jgi:hypothetical protein
MAKLSVLPTGLAPYACRFRGASGFIVGKGLAAAAVSFWIKRSFSQTRTRFWLRRSVGIFFACGSELVELAIAMALFSSPNSPPNSTMQKEDSPSHQNVGKCMEY